MNFYRPFVFFAFVCLLALMPQMGFAEEKTTQSGFEAIMDAASKSGIPVIVVNPEGQSTNTTTGEPIVTQSGSMGLTQLRRDLFLFRTKLKQKLKALPGAEVEALKILRDKSPTGSNLFYVKAVAWSLLFLFIGEIFTREIFGKRIIGPWFVGLQKENPVGYSEKLPILAVRTIIGFIGVFITVLVSYGIGYSIFGEAQNETVRITVGYIYVIYVTCRLVTLVWRMIVAPYLEQYRIPNMSDKDAVKLYRWMSVGATINIVLMGLGEWIEEMGIAYNTYAILTILIVFLIVLLNIAFVFANRIAITNTMLDGKPVHLAALPSRIWSRLWVPLVVGYFIYAWLEMSYRLIMEIPLRVPLITGFYSILLTVMVVYGVVSYIIERFFQRKRIFEEYQARMREESGETEGAEILPAVDNDHEESGEEATEIFSVQQIATYEDLARRVAGILAMVAGLFWLTKIWQIDPTMVVGPKLDRLYDILMILLIGYVVYHLVRIWIDNKINEEGGHDAANPGDEGGGSGASRLATLLPLFRNTLLAVIFVSVGLIVLMQMGINVAPLFAGAGVVGLAIGFGSQALVKDIFSGAFFLFDDAFRKGEYIDIGSVKGTVEKVSVRSFQLRHHLGPLHTIPFGEINFLTNYSRDWVMMKLPLRVTYDTDVEKVRKLIKKLGTELLDDPVIGNQFLQPLKSQGVIEMQDSAMIIRVKFMTKPGDQWVIRKRVFLEIQTLFEKNGIKFAHKEVTVRIAGSEPKSLTEQQRTAVGAGALSAVEEMEEQDNE